MTEAYCQEQALSKTEAKTDAVCQKSLGLDFWMSSFFSQYLKPNVRTFAVVGRREGKGTIKFLDKRREVVRLDIDVKELIRVPLAFNIAHHLENGNKPHVPNAKNITKSSLLDMLGSANRIMKQSGVIFTLRSINYPKADFHIEYADFRTWGPKPPRERTAKILLDRDKNSPLNVFLFNKIINNVGSDGITVAKQDIAMTAENAVQDVDLLAHELTHALGCDHIPRKPKTKKGEDKGKYIQYENVNPLPPNLMNEGGTNDFGLNQSQIERMRKRATQLI